MTTTTSTMRTFATGTRGGVPIVHDPLTGLTHRADGLAGLGRACLPAAKIVARPVVHPGQLPGQRPVSVCWSPLVRCNLACPHCLDDKTVAEARHTDRQRVAGVLATSGVLGVDISGGEPLLLRDLGQLADQLTTGDCVVSVTTNGWHLARRAEGLAPRIDAIRVSLDGPDADQHDRWRGHGSFARAVAGVRAAVAHGIPTQLHTVLLRSNVHNDAAQRTVDLAADLGANGVTFLQLLPIGEAITMAADEQLTDQHAADLVADLVVPAGLAVRLRTREAASGFTVVRADGQVWRNSQHAEHIATQRPLRQAADLALTGRDGSA